MLERLLEPNSTDVPDCICGRQMRYVRIVKRSADAAVKHFECDACRRELLLMVWPEIALPDREGAKL